MKASVQTNELVLTPDEINRRINEYRREGFQRHAMPHIVYVDPFVVCPWSECDYRIAAVDFQIEKLNQPDLYKNVMSAWWQGAGIVASCPNCGKYVLFSMSDKKCIEIDELGDQTVLAEDWHVTAHIVNG